MNIRITKEEYESLPFRDGWKGAYIKGQYYRAKAHPGTVFLFVGTYPYPEWWAFDLTKESLQ